MIESIIFEKYSSIYWSASTSKINVRKTAVVCRCEYGDVDAEDDLL